MITLFIVLYLQVKMTPDGTKITLILHCQLTENLPCHFHVCKTCQFWFVFSVLSVMSVSGFPLIIMSAHAQCSIWTCSVEGIPSLVCLHMLSQVTSLISMHSKQWRILTNFVAKTKKNKKRRIRQGEYEEKVRNPSSSPKICHLCHGFCQL